MLPCVTSMGYMSATEILDELDRGASGGDTRVSSSGDDELGGVIFICRGARVSGTRRTRRPTKKHSRALPLGWRLPGSSRARDPWTFFVRSERRAGVTESE